MEADAQHIGSADASFFYKMIHKEISHNLDNMSYIEIRGGGQLRKRNICSMITDKLSITGINNV